MTTTTFTADASSIYPQPECGPRWSGDADDFLTNPSNLVSAASDCYNGRGPDSRTGTHAAGPMRLMLAAMNLPAGAISGGALANMQTAFNTIRSQGLKVIALPRYAGSDSGMSVMLSQAAQMAPVFEANKDVLQAVHAGFLGEFGEWATPIGTALTVANKTAIKDAILAMTPKEVPVEFTNPFMMSEVWYGSSPLSATEAFSGSDKSRSGVFDDCWETGLGDSHTYWAQGSSVNGYTIQTTLAAQRAYVRALSQYAPVGGETCNDGQGAINQMRINGTGYTNVDGIAGLNGGVLNAGPGQSLNDLNRSFALEYWNQWATEGSTYTTVYQLMGPRIRLDALTHPATISRAGGAIAMFTVDLRNTGWSIPHNPTRRVQVRLDDGAGHVIVAYSTAQLRQLPRQAVASTRFFVPVPIPSNAVIATYNVSIAAPDGFATLASRRDYAIRLANANSGGQTWDNTNGRMSSGTTLQVLA